MLRQCLCKPLFDQNRNKTLLLSTEITLSWKRVGSICSKTFILDLYQTQMHSAVYQSLCCPVVRLPMAGNPEEPELLMKLQGTATGLALDWIHQLLYWTSAESASLNVGLLDGSAQRPLITGLDRPSAVAVEPLHRWPGLYQSSLIGFCLFKQVRYRASTLAIDLFFSFWLAQAALLGPVWQFCKDWEGQPGRSGPQAIGHTLNPQSCGSVSGYVFVIPTWERNSHHVVLVIWTYLFCFCLTSV